VLAPVIKQAGVEVERTYPADERAVDADPNQLRQVFLNLILNAVQAGGSKGRLAATIRQSGRETRVTMTDNGTGMEPDKLKSVFEPFYTTKPGGTGLGLPIAQRIVAEHGGRLLLESRPGEGTTATVILPGR